MKFIKLFLRLAIAAGFLSAVADRFGLWSPENSAWGNWHSFVQYTSLLIPWLSDTLVSIVAILATAAEAVLGCFLIVGFKTETMAKLSGWLLLLFALSMTFALGIKKPLDFSVFSASAAAFALSTMRQKNWEIDSWIKRKSR